MNAHTPFDANQDWTNPYCQNSSNDPMVDALLGNAYHVVRTVYCNLGNLKLIYDFLNQYGMVLGVQSEAELKALTTKAKYARIYGFSRAGDRQVTDYLYVEGDRTGILPDDTTATGSWITVATSGSNGGSTSSGEGAYIPWVYSNGSATGGETSINVPDGTVGVPFIIINGDMQYVGRGFEFNADNLSVTLAQPLEEGDEVVFLLTGVPAVPDNPNVNDWVQINWLYNNGVAVGGEQVIAIPYTFQSIPAVYKNGLRLYKGLTTESYTVDPDNQRIFLTEPLATNDRLIVQIGGEAQILEAADHTLQEVARVANVKDSEVILSTNTTQSLNGKKVVFSVNEQKSYGLPVLPTNVYIQSVAEGKLTYSPGSVVVDLLALPGSSDELKAELASDNGYQLIPSVTKANYVEVGDPRGFGGVGDGVADDTAAVEAALQTGKLYIDQDTTYRVTRTCVHTGKVHITGTGKIISDFKGTLADPAFAIKIIDGTDSIVDGSIAMEPGTVPYTIRRDNTWAMVGTWEQRFDGYIPTPQDSDIWASVPSSIRTHNERIGTGILFVMSGTTAGTNVDISGIRGHQVNIVLQGYCYSSVHDISAGLGQFTLGGIYFHNGVVRAYNQALLGYRLARGVGNSAYGNRVKYSSLCGIVFCGNDKHDCYDNHSTHNAESGIKTVQFDNVEGITEDTAVMCTRGHYYGNYTANNYYDGLDLQSIYGAGFSFVFGGHLIENNISEFNRLTGMHSNSAYCRVSGNFANYCGDTGIAVTGTGNTVFGNKALDCAQAPSNSQAFQIAIQGDDCVSYGNSIKKLTAHSTYDYIHTGLLGADPTGSHEGLDYGNYCEEGAGRLFVSPNIPSQKNSFVAPIVTKRLSTSKPVNVVGNYTVGAEDYSLSCYTASGAVLTLPDPATYPGRILEIRNTTAYGIVSASANVGQITGGAPSTDILPATVGSWCKMQSDGSVWLILAKG